MNHILDENNGFESIAEKICIKGDDYTYHIKKEYGDGTYNIYSLGNGLNIYLLDASFTTPQLVKWCFSEDSPKEYYLMHNISEISDFPSSQTGDTPETGATAFIQNNERRRLWLPNLKYKVLTISFTEKWLKQIMEIIQFRSQLATNLQSSNNLYLHSKTTSASRLVVTQILNYISGNSVENFAYLQIKILELSFLFFSEVFKEVSTDKNESSIHTDDLAKLNAFVGSLNSQLENLPNIKNTAEILSMSESKFQRLFKTFTGTTYYDYIFKLRMDISMELLTNKLSVTEVAIRTGYSSIGNFSNAFKRCFNMNPSEI